MTEFIVRNEEIRSSVIKAIRELDLTAAWRIEWKRFRRQRTLSQNALLHKWFGIIADETGNDSDDMKEFYRKKYLPEVPKEIGGEEVLIPQSTKKLNTAEMSAFMAKVEAHAGAFFNVRLPQPEEGHLQ